jgi:hypothetical protein
MNPRSGVVGWCLMDCFMLLGPTYSSHTSLSSIYIKPYFNFTNHGHPILLGSRDSDWLRAGWPRCRRSSPGGVKNFLLFTSSSPAPGPTQPPIKWVPGALSSRVKLPGREADHHLQLVPRSRKCRSIHPLPHTPLWRST